jgi:GTP-binding protein
MERFNPELMGFQRWLVLNKIDLLPEADCTARCDDIVARLNWEGPVFRISAIHKQGTQELCYKIMEYIEQRKESGMTGV